MGVEKGMILKTFYASSLVCSRSWWHRNIKCPMNYYSVRIHRVIADDYRVHQIPGYRRDDFSTIAGISYDTCPSVFYTTANDFRDYHSYTGFR